MDEDRHLLVHRVGPEQEVALVGEVLLEVVVAQALEPQRHPHSDHPWARPCAQQEQLAAGSWRCHCSLQRFASWYRVPLSGGGDRVVYVRVYEVMTKV